MPASDLATLTATVLGELHRWGEVAILECEIIDATTPPEGKDDLIGENKIVKVKAFDCEEGEFEIGMPFAFYGQYQTYTPKKNYSEPWKKPVPEQQFHARKWRKVRPYDKQGVLKWLIQAPGIKHAIALKLWNAYGAYAIQRVKDEPEKVSMEIGAGFTEERARMASAHFKSNETMEAAFVDLGSLLDGRGFPHSLPKKLARDYGGDAAQAMKKNPWLLLQYKSTGVSRVDKLYCDLARAKGEKAYKAAISSIKRQAIILWKCLMDAGNTTGDVWQREEAAKAMLKDRIAGAEVRFRKAMELGVRGGLIAARWEGISDCWLAEGRRAAHERYIAQRVAELPKTASWPKPSVDSSPHQRVKLIPVLESNSPWIILGGSPGTGKTWCAAQIVQEAAKRIGMENIAAAAPTGRAAVRLSEVMDGYGIKLQARTIHSLLGVKTTPEVDGWGFAHDEKTPLDFQLIVLDECSMVDLGLFAAFLRAIPATTQLLIVGDCAQLPPVGAGCPLRDLIAAGIPSATLTEIRRNSGTIVKACAAIRDGQKFITDARIEWEKNEADPDSPHNLLHVATTGNKQSAEKIIQALRQLKTRGYDPVWDCQILVSVNGDKTKSELSRIELNKILQNELNPSGQRCGDSPFRTNDKIICLKNGLVPLVTEDDDSPYFKPGCETAVGEVDRAYLANGELGRVLGQQEKLVFAQFDAPLRIVKIPRGKAKDASNGDDDIGDGDKTNTGCKFDLAFSITIWKSQGTEIPVVLFGIDEGSGARMNMTREAVYTAISRAKKACIMFGKRVILDGFCRKLALAPRKTFLKEAIAEAVAELEASRK